MYKRQGLYKSCFKFIFGFSIILFVVYVLSLCVPKILFVPVYIIANFSKKIYSCVMVGTLIIKTTTVRMLIISLEKWKVSSLSLIHIFWGKLERICIYRKSMGSVIWDKMCKTTYNIWRYKKR